MQQQPNLDITGVLKAWRLEDASAREILIPLVDCVLQVHRAPHSERRGRRPALYFNHTLNFPQHSQRGLTMLGIGGGANEPITH